MWYGQKPKEEAAEASDAEESEQETMFRMTREKMEAEEAAAKKAKKDQVLIDAEKRKQAMMSRYANQRGGPPPKASDE